MNGADLLDLLVTTLMRQFGGTRRGWNLVLGQVRVYDEATHPHCNWSLAPSGTPRQTAAVERVLDDVRLRYPIIRQG